MHVCECVHVHVRVRVTVSVALRPWLPGRVGLLDRREGAAECPGSSGWGSLPGLLGGRRAAPGEWLRGQGGSFRGFAVGCEVWVGAASSGGGGDLPAAGRGGWGMVPSTAAFLARSLSKQCVLVQVRPGLSGVPFTVDQWLRVARAAPARMLHPFLHFNEILGDPGAFNLSGADLRDPERVWGSLGIPPAVPVLPRDLSTAQGQEHWLVRV